MEPIQVAEIRSKGRSYRAEMYPIYKPSYVGAAPLTKYFVFNREWKEVPYNALPATAYQALRRALKVDMAKGPMRDPVKRPKSDYLSMDEHRLLLDQGGAEWETRKIHGRNYDYLVGGMPGFSRWTSARAVFAIDMGDGQKPIITDSGKSAVTAYRKELMEWTARNKSVRDPAYKPIKIWYGRGDAVDSTWHNDNETVAIAGPSLHNPPRFVIFTRPSKGMQFLPAGHAPSLAGAKRKADKL